MAKERQDYVGQRMPQIVDQIMEAMGRPVIDLKRQSGYLKDRLRGLIGPQYDNHLFRRLLSCIDDSDNYVAKNMGSYDDDDDDEELEKKKVAYSINGNNFKQEIESFAGYLAGFEYDKRAQGGANAQYDGLQEFLSLWNKATTEVGQSVQANDKQFSKLKAEVDAYVGEHAPQLKGRLMSMLAPGGKLMLTAGWAAGLDSGKVKKFLKNIKSSIENYAKRAKEVGHKSSNIKKVIEAIDDAIDAGASENYESENFEGLYDDFIKEVTELECKLGMKLDGKQPNFLVSFGLKFKTAEADCDALGWQDGKISRENYVEWKADAYRFSLLEAISGSNIYAKKGLSYRLNELRSLKDGVYAHESWGKLLDVFAHAQYKDFRHNKAGRMLQQAVMDEELSAALDAFVRHAAETEYDLRKSDPSKDKAGVLRKCMAVIHDADEEFLEHERDVASGQFFKDKQKDADAYVEGRAPAINEELQKLFGNLFRAEQIGFGTDLTKAQQEDFARLEEKLAGIRQKLLPVSKSFDDKWNRVCDTLVRACGKLAKGEKLSALDAENVSEEYGRMGNLLAGYEYWQKELSMGMTAPDSSELVTAAFSDGEDPQTDRKQDADKDKDKDEFFDLDQEISMVVDKEKAYTADQEQKLRKEQKREDYLRALRGMLSFSDTDFDGTKPKTELAYHVRCSLSELLQDYAQRVKDLDEYTNDDLSEDDEQKKNDARSEKLSAVAADIGRLGNALWLHEDPNSSSNRTEEESRRLFEEALANLAQDLVELDDEMEEDIIEPEEDIVEPEEEEPEAWKDDLIHLVDRMDALDESLDMDPADKQEEKVLKTSSMGAGKIFEGLSKITKSLNEDMENLRTIELAVNIILETADNLDEAIGDMRKMLTLGTRDIIHFTGFLEESEENPDLLPEGLKKEIISSIRGSYLVSEYYRENDSDAPTPKHIRVITEQICSLAKYYMHRRSEPGRKKPVGYQNDVDERGSADVWKEQREKLSAEYAASRETEALAALDSDFGGMEAMWEDKAYSKNLADPTKNDEAFNKMERVYGRFRSIVTALKRKRSQSEPLAREDLELFKANRNALFRSAENYLSQMGDGQGNEDTLLQGRRELASHIKKGLRPYATKASETSLLMPGQPAAEAHQPSLRQEEPGHPEEESVVGKDFAQTDYHVFLQGNSKRVNQYMNFFMQRYGITSNEISLILGKDAKKGKEMEQAYTVIYDIIARNQIPTGVVPEERIIFFVNTTCKKIRQNMKKASMAPENRLKLAEGLASLLPTSEFDLERDYEQQPLSDKEKSGYHAKMTLQNYFYYLDEDNYNPDAWYKSGKFSDLVGEWSRKRMTGSDQEARIEALRQKIDKKWKFGKELSDVLARQMDKAFSELEEKAGLDAGSDHYDKDMEKKVKHEYISSLYMFRCMVNDIPSQKFADFNIELPPEIHDNVFASPLSTFTLKVDYRPAATEESLAALEEMIRNAGGENVDSVVGSLTNVKLLLQNVEAFDLNLSMLSTRKLFRVFNWNSSEYNHCRSSLEQLKGKRDTLLRALAALQPGQEGMQQDPQLLTGISALIGELNEAQKTCFEAVEAYNNKVFIENVRDKKQSAGMARFAGAQGMASLLRNADGTLLSQKETFRGQPQNEEGGQQLQKFRSAYKQEQEMRQAFGEKAVQRGAANKAKATVQV